MIRLAQILELPALGVHPLVVSKPDAQVRWVATSELIDPSPFLEGGEILLTTGLAEREPTGWHEFAERCHRAGVVAIGFGVGLSHTTVPAELIVAARELELNLFSVPQELPFIAVSRAVADLLADAENTGIRESLIHQQKLTRAAESAAGASAVLNTLSQTLGGGVILTDSQGSVLVASSVSGGELLVDALPLIDRLATASIRGAASEITSHRRVTVHPVGTEGSVDAYLVVETAGPLSTPHRSAITTAIALLALDRRRARAERDADRRLRAGVFSLALQGALSAAESLLGPTPPGPGLPDAPVLVLRARGTTNALETALSRLETDLARGAAILPALLRETDTDTDSTQLVVLGSALQAGTSEFLTDLTGLQLGVSAAHPLEDAALADAQAREALALTTPSRAVVQWPELVDTGVDALLAPSTLRAFAAEFLSGVLDRPDSAVMLDTLHAFLVHNGQIEPAARALGVHRNTLTNRLDTAQNALHRSLQNPQTRADLWVALKQRADGGDTG